MNTRFGRMTTTALLIGLLIAALGTVSVASASNSEHGGMPGKSMHSTATCCMASASNPEQRGLPKVSLSTAEAAALHAAINEEYLARDTYRSVLAKLGTDVMPFSRIALSEQQHVDALAALFAKYGLATPSDPGLAANPIFTDRREACQIGVYAELHDIALYDDLLASGDIAHADLIQVFTNLWAASLTNHLPAFDACN